MRINIRYTDITDDFKFVTNEVWRYFGTTWEISTPLQQARHGHRTAMIDGEIHHIGGCKTIPCQLDVFRFDKKLK